MTAKTGNSDFNKDWSALSHYEIEPIDERDYFREYRARHKQDNTKVIAKFYSLTDEARRQWVSKRQELAWKLKSPDIEDIANIFGYSDDELFVVWEYRGESLRSKIMTDTPPISSWPNVLSPPSVRQKCLDHLDKVLAYTKLVYQALEQLHKNDVFSYRLNPDNIFFTQDNATYQTKVMFCNLAIGVITSADFDKKAYTYLAPELHDSDLGVVCAATDVYGLAAILYEAITGRPVFYVNEESRSSAVLAQLLQRPPSMQGIPRQLRKVFQKALAKRVSQRYQSVKEFCEDFSSACKEILPKARPSIETAARDHFQWSVDQRRRRLVGLGVLATVTALLGVAAFSANKKPFLEAGEGKTRKNPLPGKISSTGNTGKPQTAYRHDAVVNVVALSEDGKMLATADEGGRIIVVNAMDFSQQYLDDPYQHNNTSITGLAWDANNQYLVSSDELGTLNLWDMETRQVIASHTLPGKSFALAWAKFGGHLIAGYNNIVWVCDDPANNAGFRNTDASFKGHLAMIYALAISPDGKYVVSGSQDRTVQITHVDPATPVFRYGGHTGEVVAAAYSPDGKFIATGSVDHSVQVWNALENRGDLLFSYKHKGTVRCVAFSSDGSFLASGSEDGQIFLYWLHDTSTPFHVYSSETQDPVKSIAWIPNKWVLVLADGNEVRTWRVI